MGRDVTSDSTPLLKNADQNIGNSTILYPQAGTVGVVIPTTNPPRLLNLTGGSAVGQTVSVVMTVSRILQGNDNPNPGFPGPITGIIEFGNGGRFTKIEFDLTVGPFAGSINEASSAVEPQDGVTIVTVPTGVLRVYARYDNLLLAPLIGTNPPISHAQLTRDLLPFPGLPIVGPGGPLTVTNSAPPPATLVISPRTRLGQSDGRLLHQTTCEGLQNDQLLPLTRSCSSTVDSDWHPIRIRHRLVPRLRLLGSGPIHAPGDSSKVRWCRDQHSHPRWHPAHRLHHGGCWRSQPGNRHRWKPKHHRHPGNVASEYAQTRLRSWCLAFKDNP